MSAEKLEAIVRFALANSRMKDYFDLYMLSFMAVSESAEVSAAIAAMFSRRGTPRPGKLPPRPNRGFCRGQSETKTVDRLPIPKSSPSAITARRCASDRFKIMTFPTPSPWEASIARIDPCDQLTAALRLLVSQTRRPRCTEPLVRRKHGHRAGRRPAKTRYVSSPCRSESPILLPRNPVYHGSDFAQQSCA